ncbi:methylated-DNA--[protein]-cysteine S-methyltransferase [Candidatus Tisiphia endosymbiont of Nemotelus uliginosus]|uniref:methylated-DNA--[protein]-cysteine S-methyltransferase n=1 Tax=Candidatus Tisiphia endosymbiont of Nemotelus uliginosus TaxID=3077926 RepID=UPI0035C89A3A
MPKIIYQYINLPISTILLTSDGTALTGLYFAGQKHAATPNIKDYEQGQLSIFSQTYTELTEYLSNRRKEFTIPYNFIGTDFQKKVWSRLCSIPYGQVLSYKAIADLISAPNAFRAVANAISRNNLSIIVPCHRVIGSNFRLTGYAAGLAIKQKLLNLESGIVSSI